MMHKIVTNDAGKSCVYSQVDNIILATNVNNQGFAPGVAFVLVPQAEFTVIKELVKQCKESGTARLTARSRDAKDLDSEKYFVSVIAMDNGYLVDVQFKTGELKGLSLKWRVDTEGNTAFKQNETFVWFSPSGATYFDFGFERIKAKLARQRYNNETKKFETEYADPAWLTVPTQSDSASLMKAANGMKILEAIIDFAKEKLAPAGPKFDDIPFTVGAAK